MSRSENSSNGKQARQEAAPGVDIHGSDPPQERSLGADERDRLNEIAALGLTSPDVDEVLQEIAAKAARRLDLPISLVSVVLDEAQYFAASYGLEGWLAETRGTPVEWSFCTHAVRSGQPFTVEDAAAHALVKDNPLVTQEVGIRCYLGIPLVSANGHALGTLCVIGSAQRTFSESDVAALRALAEEAVQHIEKRRG